MFIKTYHYRILQENYPQWKELSAKSDEIYQEIADVHITHEVKASGKEMVITEKVYYMSKEQADSMELEAGNHPDARGLTKEFTKILRGKIITEEAQI